MKSPRHILMTTPTGYRIAYAINPHMRNPDGTLKAVDGRLAFDQWQNLRNLYLELGFQVDTLAGQLEFPDLVFSANPTFPFRARDGKPGVVIGTMHAEVRRGESLIYENWAQSRGLVIEKIKAGIFEGSGDALWNFETGEIFGGFGFRTEERIYDELEALTGAPIHRLKLIDPRFYHLDTCLAILNATTAAYVPEAFSTDSIKHLASSFDELIEISEDEAAHGFAGNAFCPDGRNVIVQAGNSRFSTDLEARNFIVHQVETGEFIKAGGSVFCMKQQFWA